MLFITNMIKITQKRNKNVIYNKKRIFLKKEKKKMYNLNTFIILDN